MPRSFSRPDIVAMLSRIITANGNDPAKIDEQYERLLFILGDEGGRKMALDIIGLLRTTRP